jgi:hypothetical protein
MSDQLGFFFDAPLVGMPASQLPPPRVAEPQPVELRELLQMSAGGLVAHLWAFSEILADDIDYDDLLKAAGFTPESITGWHRARALDALLPPNGEYQAYQPALGKVRFKRLYPCPGFDGIECSSRAMTGGGVRCRKCLKLEEEDLFNQE